MSLKNEISAAIAAHGMWKTRLRSAIADGRSEFSPQNIAVDDRCVFGKWIHAVNDAKVTTSPHYRQCLALHRDFHRVAAKVLSLAIDGKRRDAEQAMAPGGEYAAISASLTRAMMQWDQSLG